MVSGEEAGWVCKLGIWHYGIVQFGNRRKAAVIHKTGVTHSLEISVFFLSLHIASGLVAGIVLSDILKLRPSSIHETAHVGTLVP